MDEKEGLGDVLKLVNNSRRPCIAQGDLDIVVEPLRRKRVCRVYRVIAFIAHRVKKKGSGQNYGVNMECTVSMILPACSMHVSASSSVNAASGVISGKPLG